MSITSFYFLIYYICVLVLYYLIPRKMQWVFLTASSVVFYLLAQDWILIIYPLVASALCWIFISLLSRYEEQKKRLAILFGTTFLFVGVLFVLKYVNFGILVPLGISYYTFSLLGYVIDVYNGIAKPNKNLAKVTLYGMFFPIMTMGPILRYREDGDQFFEPHKFNYQQVTRGMQRMLWGFFKKLVIAERMALVVNTIYGDWQQYEGLYIWVGTVAFAFQLYTDFSGAMDIVLGISQTFGITLPENFERPFFAQTISEYWRKWHITLGVWMKEYVFYPLLRTNLFSTLSISMRNRFGKKRGKQLTTFLAMFILWFTVGAWHGGNWKYIIGSGLLHWSYIVFGELLEPFFGKTLSLLHIAKDAKLLKLLRMLRTFFLVNIGFVFFRAESVSVAWEMLKRGLRNINFGVIFSGTFFTMGLDWVEMTVAIVSLVILLVVSILQERGIKIRESVAKKKLPIRWCIWYALLFYTILLAYYGPGYSAAEFIYQGF